MKKEAWEKIMSFARRYSLSLVLATLVLALFFTLFAAFWWHEGTIRKLEPKAFLPANTLFFAKWNDCAGLLQAIERSPMREQMRRKDFPAVLHELKWRPALMDRVTQTDRLLRYVNALPLIRDLLAGQGAIALLPNSVPRLSLRESLEVNAVLFVSEQSDGGAGLEALINAEEQKEENLYRGVVIKKSQLRSGQSLYACSLRGVRLYAFTPGPLRLCLDHAMSRTVNSQLPVLDERTWLKEGAAPVKQGEFFVYADVCALRGQFLWDNILLPRRSGLTPQQLYVRYTVLGEAKRFQTRVTYNVREFDRWLEKRKLSGPAQPPLAASQDGATLMHLWSNWFTQAVYERLLAMVNATEFGAPLFAAASEFFGEHKLTRKNFYQHFAPELGLVVQESAKKKKQITPLFSLYFKKKDRSVTPENFRRLFAAFPLSSVKLAHGAEAMVIGMVGNMIQPAVVFSENELLLADNLDMAWRMEGALHKGGEKTVLTRAQEASQSTASPADKPEPIKASLYLFLRNKRVAEVCQNALEYLKKAKNERGHELLTAREKLFVEHIAQPFFQTIGQVETSCFSFMAGKGEMQAVFDFFPEQPASEPETAH